MLVPLLRCFLIRWQELLLQPVRIVPDLPRRYLRNSVFPSPEIPVPSMLPPRRFPRKSYSPAIQYFTVLPQVPFIMWEFIPETEPLSTVQEPVTLFESTMFSTRSHTDTEDTQNNFLFFNSIDKKISKKIDRFGSYGFIGLFFMFETF